VEEGKLGYVCMEFGKRGSEKGNELRWGWNGVCNVYKKVKGLVDHA